MEICEYNFPLNKTMKETSKQPTVPVYEGITHLDAVLRNHDGPFLFKDLHYLIFHYHSKKRNSPLQFCALWIINLQRISACKHKRMLMRVGSFAAAHIGVI
jgi:hypothetical protein